MHQNDRGIVAQVLASAVANYVLSQAAGIRTDTDKGLGEASNSVLIAGSVGGFHDAIRVKEDGGTAIHFNFGFGEIAIENSKRHT